MKNLYLTVFLLSSINLFSQYPDWIYYSKSNGFGNFVKENNYLWATSNVGIMKMDVNTGTKTYFDKVNSPIPDSWVSALSIDNNGCKWFGTWDKGCLMKFNDTSWTVYDTTNSLLTGYSISNIAVDNINNIWIISSNATHGLIKFDGNNWTIYDTSNSEIPSNYITTIFCTDSIVWLAKNNSLIKFDGINWVSFDENNSSISGSDIKSIKKDNFGNLWLLHSNGVEKFDGAAFYNFNDSNTNIPNKANNSMTIDQNNIIWTGCSAYNLSPHVIGGIMSFDGINWTKYDSTNSPITDELVTSVYIDDINNLWYNSSNEGTIGKKNGSNWSTYNPSKAGIGDNHVRQIKFDGTGKPFIATYEAYPSGNALIKFDWNNWIELDNYYNTSWQIETDLNSNLFTKSKNEIRKYDGTNWTTILNTPNIQGVYGFNVDLSCILCDNVGGFWIDYYKGLAAIYEPGYGWVYTPKEGLAYYNGGNWSTYDTLNSFIENLLINDIKQDNNDNLWLATNIGLIKYDGVTWTQFNTSNSSIPYNYIKSLAIDNTNNIWFSDTHYGLYKFDMVTTTNYQHPTLNNFLANGILSRDIDGSIWQITLFDLIHFDGVNWTTMNASNSPITNTSNVTSLSIDKFGNKWLGTQFGFFIYKDGGVVLSGPEINPEKQMIIAYPNPFNNKCEIKLNHQYSIVNLRVYDILGNNMFNMNYFDVNTIIISRNNLSSGIYFYVLQSKDIYYKGKLIIE